MVLDNNNNNSKIINNQTHQILMIVLSLNDHLNTSYDSHKTHMIVFYPNNNHNSHKIPTIASYHSIPNLPNSNNSNINHQLHKHVNKECKILSPYQNMIQNHTITAFIHNFSLHTQHDNPSTCSNMSPCLETKQTPGVLLHTCLQQTIPHPSPLSQHFICES